MPNLTLYAVLEELREGGRAIRSLSGPPRSASHGTSESFGPPRFAPPVPFGRIVNTHACYSIRSESASIRPSALFLIHFLAFI